MNVFLERMEYKANVYDLRRRGFEDFLFCQVGNELGFVVGDIHVIENLRGCTFFNASVKKNEKVPLYKQSMQLQMGRIPKSTTSVNRRYQVRVLDNADNRFYSVWRIVF